MNEYLKFFDRAQGISVIIEITYYSFRFDKT